MSQNQTQNNSKGKIILCVVAGMLLISAIGKLTSKPNNNEVATISETITTTEIQSIEQTTVSTEEVETDNDIWETEIIQQVAEIIEITETKKITDTTIAEETTITTELTTVKTNNLVMSDKSTLTVKAGAEATISMKGTPNTEYKISIMYKSGRSEAQGLENKTSDADGNVSWTWIVGARTTPGTYKADVYGGDEQYIFEFTVSE